MTEYEILCEIARGRGLAVKRLPLDEETKGLIKGARVAIRDDLTEAEAADTLAEEIAHDALNAGDITDLSVTTNRKQEMKARMLAYDIRIGLSGIVACCRYGCRSRYEMAKLLGVSEEFLAEALEHYRRKYGDQPVSVDNYMIVFEPRLGVIEMI